MINCIQCGKRGDFGGGAMAYIAEWVWSGGVPIPWGWKGGWGMGLGLLGELSGEFRLGRLVDGGCAGFSVYSRALWKLQGVC